MCIMIFLFYMCMYVCMYVTYVCMYITYVRICARTYVRMYVRMYGTAQSNLDTRVYQTRVHFRDVLSETRMLLEC